ncbi:MAG: DUF402 domain-containing protein [Clostridia bacterium]|nr:DUF402 domain-containing protein [Clostridia bacterium]
MKRKRLDRDSWGFQHFPYYQMRVDLPEFCGLASLIRLTSGEKCYWHMPRAGKVAVCGAGMTWLQLIPDDAHHIITVKYRPGERVSVWYADVIDHVEYDPDGVAAFVDAYLDVIFSPKGDMKVDDRDELDAAYASGELTAEQYSRVLQEGDAILHTLCADMKATERWCRSILRHVKRRLDAPDTLRKNV